MFPHLRALLLRPPLLRPRNIASPLPQRSILSFLKRTPPPPVTTSTPAAKHAFPSRFLVYYAGKRTIYLGTLKLYTVLLFSYSTLLAAPQLLYNDHSSLLERLHLPTTLPRWVLPTAVVVGSAVPLAFVSWLSPPYVTHMYLNLPPWARHSRQHLKSYLQQLPRDAQLDLGSIRWFGRPRLTRVTPAEMRMCRERLGCVNVRVSSPGSGKEQRFYVDWRRSPAVVEMPEALGEVAKAVGKWGVGVGGK